MQKRALSLALLFIFCAAPFLAGETFYEPEFLPRTPELMGQGGSFSSVSTGFNALFTNPAGFAIGDSSFTMLSNTLWTYFMPDLETLTAVQTFSSDPVAAIGGFNDLMTSTGFGLGLSESIAYVGNGLGFGFFTTADLFAIGPNTLGVTVDPHVTVAFVGGMSVPFELGPFKLYVGGDVRPMLRVHAPDVGVINFLTLFGGSGGSLAGVTALHGVTMAMDLGTMLTFGPLSLGLSVRDLGGTRFNYSISPIDDTFDALKTGTLPTDGTPVPDSDRYVIPMTATLGIGFHPVIGLLNYLIDFKLHADYRYRFVIPDERGSFWTGVHAGAEMTLFSLFNVRAGVQQGYLTAGAGFHMVFLDVNFAIYSRELGSYAGAKRNTGVTAEIALRL